MTAFCHRRLQTNNYNNAVNHATRLVQKIFSQKKFDLHPESPARNEENRSLCQHHRHHGNSQHDVDRHKPDRRPPGPPVSRGKFFVGPPVDNHVTHRERCRGEENDHGTKQIVTVTDMGGTRYADHEDTNHELGQDRTPTGCLQDPVNAIPVRTFPEPHDDKTGEEQAKARCHKKGMIWPVEGNSLVVLVGSYPHLLRGVSGHGGHEKNQENDESKTDDNHHLRPTVPAPEERWDCACILSGDIPGLHRIPAPDIPFWYLDIGQDPFSPHKKLVVIDLPVLRQGAGCTRGSLPGEEIVSLHVTCRSSRGTAG